MTGKERRSWHPAGTDRAEAERLAAQLVAKRRPVDSTQFLRRIVKNAGVPTIRFQDLRHTHGSLLIQDGIPVKVVSERLGHAHIAHTIQTYQHLLPACREEDRLIGRNARRTMRAQVLT